MQSNSFDIVIAGVGGQGTVSCAKLAGEAALWSGSFVTIGEFHGVSQRGGSVVSHLRISADESPGPIVPRGLCSLVLAFEPIEALRTFAAFGAEQTVVVFDPKPIAPVDCQAGTKSYPSPYSLRQAMESRAKRVFAVEAHDEAQSIAAPKTANMVLLSAAIGLGLLPFDTTALLHAMRDVLPSNLHASNERAMEAGLSLARSRADDGKKHGR